MRGKPFHSRKPDSAGFTLIEIIISLIVASILGAMLVSFMGSNVMLSGNPVLMAQNGAYLNQIMENMSADYKYLMASSSSPLATFISRIGTEGTSQSYYADASHPYTVIANHRISFPSGSPAAEQTDAGGKILKVTIQYRTLTLTALFTE